ncbi:coiled-coil domain-containing protein 62 [Alexandromys fortis]|uniref:coiled-coil domain-containing protein 62 n=1 Tax=Alexandromys fortis TaxID=100897 RepID=UPI0021534E13|nr:coiled-coil domain-containing protein 62 [Microtus fortis]
MRGREGAASGAAGLPAPVRPGANGVSEVTRCWHRLSLGAGASPMNPSATFFVRRQNIGSEVENSTIEKQRKELQLLIGELKDRDKELNDMVAVHQRQLLSWEEDRQKVLTLEERCSKLEGELHKRTDIIKSLMKKVKLLESNQAECQTALQKTQQQLQEMAQKATHSALLSEDLEARNENLSSMLVELSAQVGQLQAREQALTTMIKLKVIEMPYLHSRAHHTLHLSPSPQQPRNRASNIANFIFSFQGWPLPEEFLPSVYEEDLNEKTTENNEQREEIIRLKQEKSCLHDELTFTVEREKRKDELLDIAKSKQDRTNSELHNLRQIYVKQQSDLQFLNFNVENSHELIQIYDSKMEESKALECSRDMCLSDLDNNYPKIDIKRERNQKSLVKDQKFEVALAQHNRSDKSSCDACREKKLQVNTAFGEKGVIALSSLFTKDLLEKQKSWSLGGKIQTEPENKVTLCKIHANSPRSNGMELQVEEKQLSETSVSLPDEKQWHDINVYLGLSNCSASKHLEKPDGNCHNLADTAEISCCVQNEVCVGDKDLGESKCCHPSNIVVEAPGHMTDVEWMSIFKPSKVQRIVRHKTVCTCSGGVSGMKSSASEPSAIQPPQCLGSSKSAEREDEPEPPPDKRTSSKSVFISKDAASPHEKDDFSPTSKLQRLLAESRQMVTDLELSTLLPISCENLNRSKLEVSEEPEDKNTLVSH